MSLCATISSALLCHFLFHLRSPCTVTNLVFSGDYAWLIQQQAYTTCFVRGSNVLLISALKELVSVCVTTDEHTLHYEISVWSESLPATICTVTENSLTHIRKRRLT